MVSLFSCSIASYLSCHSFHTFSMSCLTYTSFSLSEDFMLWSSLESLSLSLSRPRYSFFSWFSLSPIIDYTYPDLSLNSLYKLSISYWCSLERADFELFSSTIVLFKVPMSSRYDLFWRSNWLFRSDFWASMSWSFERWDSSKEILDLKSSFRDSEKLCLS